MATRSGITTEVQAIVGGAARERGVAPIATYVDYALRDLNRYSPRHAKTLLTGGGTDEYALGALWNDRFSIIERVRWVPSADFAAPATWLTPEQYEVEYARTLVSSEAVGTGDGATKTFALDEDFATQLGATVTVNAVTQASTVYAIEGGEDGSAITFATAPTNGHAIVASYYVTPPQIRFASSPAAADRVVVEHTARHALTEYAGSTTLSDDEAGALAHRAAALLLRAAAGATAGTIPQGTDTDTILSSYGTAGDAYRRLAEDEDEAFGRILGISLKPGEQASAPVLITVAATPNRGNQPYLTHPRTRGTAL